MWTLQRADLLQQGAPDGPLDVRGAQAGVREGRAGRAAGSSQVEMEIPRTLHRPWRWRGQR
eukprot:916251-Prorocentrum_lima.AAC.1